MVNYYLKYYKKLYISKILSSSKVMGFSFGQISLLARYLLWLDTLFGQASPPATYLLRQPISSSNILFSHSSNPTKQFPFLQTDCFLDCPSILLWGVGELLYPLLARPGAQLDCSYSIPCVVGFVPIYPAIFHAETQSSSFSWAYHALYTKLEQASDSMWKLPSGFLCQADSMVTLYFQNGKLCFKYYLKLLCLNLLPPVLPQHQ